MLLKDSGCQELQIHFETEFFQPLDATQLDGAVITLVKAVSSEVRILLAASQQVIADDENRMAHGDQGFFLTSMSRDAVIVCLKALILCACRTVSRFYQSESVKPLRNKSGGKPAFQTCLMEC